MADEKQIYYILDNDVVVDFTEKETAFLYGTVPKSMSIDELKTILEFDERIYTYQNNVLSSVTKPKDDAKILALQQENKLLHEQVKVLSQQQEFTNDLVAELAGRVYV